MKCLEFGNAVYTNLASMKSPLNETNHENYDFFIISYVYNLFTFQLFKVINILFPDGQN